MEEEARALERTKPTEFVPLHEVTTPRDPTGLTQIDHFGHVFLGDLSEIDCLSELMLFCLFSFFLTVLIF